MIEIFKTKNNLNPTFMKSIFTERNIPYSLRSENHLQLPKVKTGTHGIENIQYRGCHLWSSLPREIKDSNTLAEFKRKIKSWDGNTCICRLCKVCTLFVDDKHRNLFQNKMFISFRRAKNLKGTLVRAKLRPSGEEQVQKGTFRCNGRRSCQICPIVVEGDTFGNFNESRSFTNFSGAYNCNSQNVVYLLQCNICNKKYVGSTTTKFRQRFNVYKSYHRTYARKYNDGSLDRGRILPVPQANFFAHFFGEGHQGAFSVSVKIIDGAHDVFSVRRKELFWQYKLGTFIPNGLNERAADVELDMFACGIA